MAGGEIYRVEIPIIVDDQTDAPLKQAERKISKFEKSARMETERIRKHFQHIAKYQIEPVMKVRDQLTANVLKADKLIRKLDLNQASPLIAAQDRVSAVVTRINAMLDALDKGKVDVVAEMQGPLLDEIIKAKKSLSELNNVKAGPIAELRGELFGQLTKAMSQIKGLDLTRAEPQVTLRERVTWKVREISSRLRDLTSRTWNIILQAKDKASGIINNITGGVRRAASLLTSPLTLLGVGGGIGGLTKLGIDMVVERENITMAFETLLGSAEAAEKRIEELTEFAGQTPFMRDEIYEASRILEVFTRGALSTSKGLKLVGDVAAGTGQDYQDVALWIGRLYDAMASGRPVGEMTARLQEMGAISGEQRALLEQLAKSGKDIAYTWPQAEKVFSRFEGQMERMSTGLGNLLTSVKSFFRETVLLRWGKGIEAELRPLLERFRQWRREHPEQVQAIGDEIERIARTGMRHIVEFVQKGYGRLKEFWDRISADPEFQKLDFGDKIIYVLNLALDEVSAWLDSEGGMKLQETFMKLGKIGAKAWIAGLKGAFKGAVSSAAHGNLLGAGAMLGLASMLGGGMVLRGAWGLGKGIWKYGKGIFEKFRPTRAAAGVTETIAETVIAKEAVTAAAKSSKPGLISRAMLPFQKIGTVAKITGKAAVPLAIGVELLDIIRAQDKVTATVKAAGGLGGGLAGAKLGALAGTAILPGIGTIVGGILGGLGGYIGGKWLGGKAVEAFREQPGAPADSTQFMQPMAEATNEVSAILGSFSVCLQGQADAVISNLTQLSEQAWNITAIKTAFAENLQSQATAVISNMEQMGRQTWRIVAIETAFAANLQGVANSIVANGKSLAGALALAEARTATFQLSSISSPSFIPTPHATGGILTRPHLGLVAEAGPEAIIPLSTRMRARAKDLWLETGRRLGVRPYAVGGFAGTVPVAVSAAAGLGTSIPGASISVTNYIDVKVGGSNADPDSIAEAIAAKIESVFHNMTK